MSMTINGCLGLECTEFYPGCIGACFLLHEGGGSLTSLSPSSATVSTVVSIEGIDIKEDYEFSYGEDLTPRQRRMALSYLMKKDDLKCCIGGEPLQLDEEGLPIADIHHLTKAQRPHKWVAKNLALACHKHNASHGYPPPSGDHVRTTRATEWTSKEGEKSELMTACWETWTGAFKLGESWVKSELAAKAMKECAEIARKSGGYQKPTLGKSITYRRYLDDEIMLGRWEQFDNESGIACVRFKGGN